jgi:hypothetical protein
LKQREEVTEDTRERGRKHANAIEYSVALLELESLVPAREEVCGTCGALVMPDEPEVDVHTWEKSCFKDTKDPWYL